MRRPSVVLGILALLSAAPGCTPAPPPTSVPFSVVEASFAEMQEAMREGRVTSREIVQEYLQRIAYFEDTLNAAMAVNRRALEEADRLDDERREGRVRGPLHGIPIALKSIINTIDMPTTGGALAFEGYTPPYDATVVAHLREAGAVLIAKTVNTELANWVASGMPGNYSAVGGYQPVVKVRLHSTSERSSRPALLLHQIQAVFLVVAPCPRGASLVSVRHRTFTTGCYGMNPYDPRRDPREGVSDGRPVMGTGGSSSGIGVAANLWAASVGTETSGSILSPSNATMLVGIKPTVGRISRYGIIPITADQDTAGPMAKSVADAAVLLGAMEGASPDPQDPATSACEPPLDRDYTPHLLADGL